MTINNFDKSISGIDLELNVFWDSDMATMYFEDNFERLDGDCYLYTEGGEYSDFERDIEIKEEDIKSILADYCKEVHGGNRRDFLEAWRYYYGPSRLATVDDVKGYLIECGHSEIERLGFLANYGELNYITVEASGNCQRDYNTIIVPIESCAYRNNSLGFDNLLYNQPLHCRLIVNGSEFYIDQDLKDAYDYDKTELLNIAKKQLGGMANKEYVINWIENNLPECPNHQ